MICIIFIQSLERELKDKGVARDTLTSEKQQLDEERDEHFRVKTTLEFDISDLKDSERNDHESRVSGLHYHSTVTCVLCHAHVHVHACTMFTIMCIWHD